jgi:predicted TIM-barrel fold metal-dependent hydrolase
VSQDRSVDEISELVVDVDVHEGATVRDLLPYLSPHWQRYITEYNFVGPPNPKPYRPATPMRQDRFPSDGGGAGSDLGLLRQQLLEDQGTSIAILNSTDLQFSTMESRYEFAIELAAAYNDYQVEHWLEREPRLRGSVQVIAHDPIAAAREIDRIGPHPQIVQVLLPAINERQYGDPMYRPIFEAALRNQLVIALHHGNATRTVFGYPRYYIEWHSIAQPHCMMAQLVSLVFNGTFDKYPDLKVVCLETGFSWLPHLMWRLDRQYLQHREEVPWVLRKPSEHLRDNVLVGTQPMEGFSAHRFMQLVDMIGTDATLLFGSDYPHYDEDATDDGLPHGLPADTRRRVMGDNAINAFPKLASLRHEIPEPKGTPAA